MTSVLSSISLVQWILSFMLIASSLGVILAKKPVHASLAFLLTLLTLATYFLQLSAQFIAVMQILVYAGAILVIFVFVIVLFQDAHAQIEKFKAQSVKSFLLFAACALLLALGLLGTQFLELAPPKAGLPESFGSVESIGKLLYLDFFFPFEAVIFLFLIAVIGALYVAKKVIT